MRRVSAARAHSAKCNQLAVLILFVFIAQACANAPVRCFVAEFRPIDADLIRTQFTYNVDVLTAKPVSLMLEQLEFGPVTEDKCTWANGHDSIELYMNSVLASSWLVHCADKKHIGFGTSTLATDVWGDTARAPDPADNIVFALEHGRIDFSTGTWAMTQTPSRYRSIKVRLFSGSTRRFMPSAPGEALNAPLIVRVCLLASEVPNDLVGSGYTEVPAAPYAQVWPLASCVYEHSGVCGAQLGYASTHTVHLKRHSHQNNISPSSAENSAPLVEDFKAGVTLPLSAEHFHAGWHCEYYNLHWVINGSRLTLDAHSPRCKSSPFDADTARVQVGAKAPDLLPITVPLQRANVITVPIEVMQQLWADNNVDVPVISDRVQTE